MHCGALIVLLRNSLQPVKVSNISQNLGFRVRFGADIGLIGGYIGGASSDAARSENTFNFRLKTCVYNLYNTYKRRVQCGDKLFA